MARHADTPSTPYTLAGTVAAHPYLTAGAVLGTVGLAAGALGARRLLGLRGNYVARHNAAPRVDLNTLQKRLQVGDIIVNAKPEGVFKLPHGMSPVQRISKRVQHRIQDAVQGDARHASIYVGDNKLVHMTPDGLIHEPVDNIMDAGSHVVRPNLPRADRDSAARKALSMLQAPPAYDWEGMPHIALNRVMPVACPPGDARTCSALIADLYGPKALVPNMESRLVTPADLVSTPHASSIGRTRERNVKHGSIHTLSGRNAAMHHLGL